MKPKILVIITRSEIGGAQKYVISMIEELTAEYEFRVLVGSYGYFSNQLKHKSIPFEVIPAIDSNNLWSAVSKLRKEIRSFKPNLVNTHSTLASIYGRVAANLTSVPLVYSVHGWFFTENASWARRWVGPIIERSLRNSTSHWITETQFDKSIGIARGIIVNPDSCTVIPNGIRKPKTLRDLKPDTKIKKLVFVGRVSYQKNPQLALKVLSKLPDDFHLMMYCDNAEHPELLKAIRKHKLELRVKLFDNEFKTAEVLHNYDLMLITSRYEGMPLSAIEGMAAGLPIVAMNACGLSELIIEKANGYLIDSADPKEFANQIEAIFSSTTTLTEMSASSKRQFDSYHRLESMVIRISTVFKKTIDAQNNSKT